MYPYYCYVPQVIYKTGLILSMLNRLSLGVGFWVQGSEVQDLEVAVF
jgi:hypothetical protein